MSARHLFAPFVPALLATDLGISMNSHAVTFHSSASRPQADAKTFFKPSNRRGFHPGTSGEQFANQGVVDTGLALNQSNTATPNGRPQIDCEPTHDLSRRVSAASVRPGIATGVGGCTLRPGHIQSVVELGIIATICNRASLELRSTFPCGVSYPHEVSLRVSTGRANRQGLLAQTRTEVG